MTEPNQELNEILRSHRTHVLHAEGIVWPTSKTSTLERWDNFAKEQLLSWKDKEVERVIGKITVWANNNAYTNAIYGLEYIDRAELLKYLAERQRLGEK